MNYSVTEIAFKVHANLKHGEEIRLSGNCPVLGCNDPNRAIPLFTSPADQPWWHTKDGLFLPGDTAKIQYRYCIYCGGKFSRWEGEGTFFRNLTDVKFDQQTIPSTLDYFGLASAAGIPENSVVTTSSIISSDKHSLKSKKFRDWNMRSHIDNDINKSDSVIIVSYFLPVILHKSRDGIWSAKWDEETILSLNLDIRTTWVGSVRYHGAPIPVEDEASVTHVLAKMNCCPIFINQNMHHQFYEIYCKQHLWLLMHHISDVYGPIDVAEIGAKSQQDLWYTYSTVNKIFRDKIVEAYHEGDLIWIQGFHLMLLPSFVRRRLQQSKIGYFFHTPFPSSEIWRTLPRREDLLRGILAADHIGFHLFEYARHFLTSCHRLLGYSYDFNLSGVMTVFVDGREVAISCIHVGVNYDLVKRELGSAKFLGDVNAWSKKFSGKIVVSGIDKLERLKGIPLKLNAIDQFMSENPQWIGKILFVIIGISAAERGNDYRQTLNEVKLMVDRLNTNYSKDANDQLVYFEEKSEKNIRLYERLTLFAASDILLINAPRDGLNLIPMEFTLAKEKAMELNLSTSANEILGCANQGLMIISEFISSARVVRGALIINPWRADEVKEALKHSLQMNSTERADRFRRNLEFSTRLTTRSWALQVLQDLKGVTKNLDRNATTTLGLGAGFRVMGVRAGFQTLNVTEVSKAYRVAHHRLILLDWGGTLVTESSKTDKLQAYAVSQGKAHLTELNIHTKQTLQLLCSDPKNHIFVVSGRELTSVSEYFGDISGLGLAAEHGCNYRWPRDEHNSSKHSISSSKWQTMVKLGDQSWRDTAKNIMDIYVRRTHGTYIEQKGHALIWQYRDADPEFGFMQSKELEDHLQQLLAGFPVEVLRGGGVADGYIEVRLAGLSKGHFLVHALEIMKSVDKTCDFILAVGDDSSDEPMFEEINRLHGIANLTSFSVTVGKKPTAANAYVDDPNAVMELLNTLARQMEREKKYYSTIDLPSQGFEQSKFTAPPTRIVSTVLGGHGISRATSAGYLGSPEDKHEEPRKVNFSSDTVDNNGQGLVKSASSAHLSMTAYLSSISEDQQDDDGLFF